MILKHGSSVRTLSDTHTPTRRKQRNDNSSKVHTIYCPFALQEEYRPIIMGSMTAGLPK
jgi:hypothetical protein